MRFLPTIILLPLLLLSAAFAQIGPIPGMGPLTFPALGTLFVVGHSGSFNGTNAVLVNTVSAGYNATKFTIALWYNPTSSSGTRPLAGAANGLVDNTHLALLTGGALSFSGVSGSAPNLVTTSTGFGTAGAWHQLTIGVDTSQATASNRVTMFVDGTQISSFSTATYPALNYAFIWFQTYLNVIGENTTGINFFGGLISEFYYIDNQNLTASAFTVGSGVGVQARSYPNAYGPLDMYLNFSNSGALGNDFSGNGINWTNENVTQSSTVPP